MYTEPSAFPDALDHHQVDADHGQKGDGPHQDGAQEPFPQRFGVAAVNDVAADVGGDHPAERVVKATHGGPPAQAVLAAARGRDAGRKEVYQGIWHTSGLREG